jgi:putative membrane protein
MRKTVNVQAFLEAVSEAVFGAALLYLVISGRYLTYVTPRMKPFLYFTVLLLLLWATMARRLKRTAHRKRYAHCFVLMLPFLCILMPHDSIQTFSRNTDVGAFFQTNANGRLNIDQQATVYFEEAYDDLPESDIPVQSPDKEASAGASSAASPAETTKASSDELAGEVSGTAIEASTETVPAVSSEPSTKATEETEKRIVVANEDFYSRLNAIYRDAPHYEGYEIVVTGFVLNNLPSFDANTFVPARLAMVCCSADLAPIGMRCKYPGASELTSEMWVTVEGIIEISDDGEPEIAVTAISPAEEVTEYVYPY